jgi:acetyltransferase-like isoleucine patch superfamily enzyme
MIQKLVDYLAGRRADGTPAAPNFPCRVQGPVHLVARNGGALDIHPTVLLNSLRDGYHVGMPFDTTLIADRAGAVIRIGEGCRIHGSYIHAWEHVLIGKSVLIAAGTNIVDSNGHSGAVRHARFRQHFQDRPKGIRIGDYAWIGMNATILKGSDIGECAIVAAGSVVRGVVPPFSVVEGNPARVVRQFDPADALEASHPMDELRHEDGFFSY